jgi:predicted nucleotidyltransferase
VIENWNKDLENFIRAANEFNVHMLMVGGGAVNFYGYQRHSADVDFWIETTKENLTNLLKALQKMGYPITEFPSEVTSQHQNISLKFSPMAPDVELITRFSVSKGFQQAYKDAQLKEKDGLVWRIISFEDLIESKLKSARSKDLLDIQELQRIRNAE